MKYMKSFNENFRYNKDGKNVIDRDENAAINMKMLGLSHLLNKCVLS